MAGANVYSSFICAREQWDMRQYSIQVLSCVRRCATL